MNGDPLDAVFRPRGIAVIGASRRVGSVGHQVVMNLRRGGYAGRLLPINPRADTIDGVTTYASIDAAAGAVDLAIVALPAPQVSEQIRRCGAQGIKAAIVLSAGFREVGATGAALETELRTTAAAAGVRLVGPNCLGAISTDPSVRMQATFAAVPAPPGAMALVAQSGAVGLHLIETAARHGIGFAELLSIGNAADLDAVACLRRWADEPAVRVILVHLESLDDASGFAAALEQAARHKPVVVLKAGRSVAGARAAASHTGAMAGSDAGVTALLRQHGAIQAETLAEFVDFARAFSSKRRPRGRGTAIVTNAGGPGILATDECARRHLPLVTLSDDTRAALAAKLPTTASLSNPVDTIAAVTPEVFGDAVRAVLADAGAPNLISLHVPLLNVTQLQIAEQVGAAAMRHPAAPMHHVLLGGSDIAAARAMLASHDVVAFEGPEQAVRALGALADRQAWLDAPIDSSPDLGMDHAAIAAMLAAHADQGKRLLLGDEAMTLLHLAGVPTLPGVVVQSVDAAEAAAAAQGFPVALKLVSAQAVHKSDIGGVQLHLQTAHDVRRAYTAMLAAARRLRPSLVVDGVLVQPMLPPERELIIGLTRDPVVGAVVLVGLGGTQAEALHDVAVRVPPFGIRTVQEMLRGLGGAALLGPWRGAAPVDEAAIVDVVLRVAELALRHPSLRELDINPLSCAAHRVVALDARMALRTDE